MTQNKNILGQEEPPIVPRIAIVTTVILMASMIVLVIVQGLRKPVSSTQDGSIEFVQSIEEVVPGQDITVSVNNVTVHVPKDATNMPGSIFLIPREPNLFAAAGDLQWTRPQVVNVEYQDGKGTPYPYVVFSNLIQICFRVTEQQWRDYARRPVAYQVQYYAEEKNPPHWELLRMEANPETFQLCGQTNHLTLFALAIKLEVGIPVTGATPIPLQGPYGP